MLAASRADVLRSRIRWRTRERPRCYRPPAPIGLFHAAQRQRVRDAALGEADHIGAVELDVDLVHRRDVAGPGVLWKDGQEDLVRGAPGHPTASLFDGPAGPSERIRLRTELEGGVGHRGRDRAREGLALRG